MTRKQLVSIIRECINELQSDGGMETPFEKPMGSDEPQQEEQPKDVTFVITGPEGEQSFVMPMEIARQLHTALMGVLGPVGEEGGYEFGGG